MSDSESTPIQAQVIAKVQLGEMAVETVPKTEIWADPGITHAQISYAADGCTFYVSLPLAQARQHAQDILRLCDWADSQKSSPGDKRSEGENDNSGI